ncbi:MAG TPA: efflux RND transporter periplasmic adaptor subunit [Anaerolineales bacterium]|nr:efflux RND transporter periplasmic adaptor subunit [Anaerolineales bacterium]
MSRNMITFILLLFGGLLIVGCGGGPAPEADATEVPITVADTQIVAEGRVVPRDSVELSFFVAGQVDEVLAGEGDVVNKGDVLARLGDREQFESQLAAAQLELTAAQQEQTAADQDLQNLYDDLPTAQTQALETLKNARKELDDAQRSYNSLNSISDQVDLDAAKAQVVLAREALDQAMEDFEPYENKPEDNLARATFMARLAVARNAYDRVVEQLNRLEGLVGSDFDIAQAKTRLDIATTRLEQSEKDYAEIEDAPDPDAIILAQKRVETAQTRLTAADSAVASAEAALDNLELVATLDGTVTRMDLIPGQDVAPGAPVAQLADFSQWYVETDNLTEIEVVDVSAGQRVTIIPDALPDVELTGSVDKIANYFEEKRGDITYTVRILVNDADPRLRWGMTVVTNFEK